MLLEEAVWGREPELEAVCGRDPDAEAISGLDAKDALADIAADPPRVADPGRCDAAVCGRDRGAAVGASDTPPSLLHVLMLGNSGSACA